MSGTKNSVAVRTRSRKLWWFAWLAVGVLGAPVEVDGREVPDALVGQSRLVRADVGEATNGVGDAEVFARAVTLHEGEVDVDDDVFRKALDAGDMGKIAALAGDSAEHHGLRRVGGWELTQGAEDD